ncbi:NAD(P)H-hydrate dehydratase [Candidatus Microgenomates bacterium]|nr:NAD(P)H-hydrate dehydratase [Candidatus Microgenomates bacterium]
MVADLLKSIYLPQKESHKGQNGRLLIIGGSHLFHSASIWALEVASRIVDLVHYSSVTENNKIVQKLKEEFRDGIIVPRSEIEEYIEEDDCILIGPGMVRTEISNIKNQISKTQIKNQNLKEIEQLRDEGEQTYYLTKYLLQKYPKKKWVIDAGALQMLNPDWIPNNAILTPHHQEFERLTSKISNNKIQMTNQAQNSKSNPPAGGPSLDIEEQVKLFAQKYNCAVLLKGEKDIIADKDRLEVVSGGNAGMTKGGTGDVLAGLVAGLYCKNDAFIAAVTASYLNKKAGEELFEKKGYWFNASDLADQIPQTMKKLLL